MASLDSIREVREKVPPRENTASNGGHHQLSRSRTNASVKRTVPSTPSSTSLTTNSNSDETINQVINLVSKRFITDQGVVKDSRHGHGHGHGHQKKETRQERGRREEEEKNKYITINVSGVTFKTKQETLARYPNTLLGNQSDRSKYYDERNGELFFDRHSPTFPAILYYYQSNGRLHKPLTINMTLFKEELTFFKIKYEGLLEEPTIPTHSRSRWSVAAAAAAANNSDGVNAQSVDPINSNPACLNAPKTASSVPPQKSFLKKSASLPPLPPQPSCVSAPKTGSTVIVPPEASYQFTSTKERPIMQRNGSGNSFGSRRRETVSTMDSSQKVGNAPMVQNSGRQSVVQQPMVRKESVMSNLEAEKVMFSPHPADSIPPYQYHNKRKSLKMRIYDLLENPETSLAAKIFSWVSMGLIVLSVGTFIAETMPDYKEDLKRPWQETNTGVFFFSFETCCIIFFTIELIGRFTTCPNKKKFIRNKLNIIDLISILPYYIELIIPKDLDTIGSLVILRVLRLFRVLRIFKLSRHSKNMIAFGIALKASLAELLSLGLFLAIDVVVFASALYYCEMDDGDADLPPEQRTKFDSIPSSCWWAVVTVTTLGYGDMYPETAMGKVLGTFCVFSGILVIAFQMPIMVAKFTWTFMQNTNSPEPGEGEDMDEFDELEEDKLMEEEEDEENLLRPVNGGPKELSAA